MAQDAEIGPHDSSGAAPAPLDDVRRKRAQARRVEALALRLAGLSYEQIGDRLDISPEGALDLVRRTLTRAENLAVEQMREMEGARLDRAQAAIWTRVLEGDIKAVDSFLRISHRRANLFGLDAPTKIDLSVTVRQEMEQALAELNRVVLLGEVVRDDDSDPDAGDYRAIES